MTQEKSKEKSGSSGHRTRVGMERRARTRSRILAAALRVFAKKGPDAVVIDDFIREAGVARGTFYNYFTRTDQLLVAVSESLEDDLMLSIEEAISDLQDPVSRLATGVRLWLGWARTDPVWCAFIVRNRLCGPLVERQINADLKNGRGPGGFAFQNVSAARDLLVGTILEVMSRNMATPVSKAYSDAVARSILAGLGVSPARVKQLMNTPLPRLRRPVQNISAA